MKAQQTKAKPLMRRAAAPPVVQRAPARHTQHALGNTSLGATTEIRTTSQIMPQIIRRQSEDDESLLRFRGGKGESGIGTFYVKGWSKLSAEDQNEIRNCVRFMDTEAALGLTRQSVPAVQQRAAKEAARLARTMLQLGPNKAAAHLPDQGAGGKALGPIAGAPKQANASFGGQLNRYGHGFTFTGFSLYDHETGEFVYESDRHYDKPLPVQPGSPAKGLTGPGAVASGIEGASKGQSRSARSAPASRATDLRMLPPSMPALVPSARGQAFEAGGLIVLSGLNALLNWLGGNRQAERAAQAGVEIAPIISKHLKENPKDGVLVVAFYHQVNAHPDSLIVPGPVFSHLEYEFGETREQALEKFQTKPSLRPYYPNEHDVRQFSWLPPAAPASKIVLPQLELGRLDDPAEHEAEAAAERIMRMPAGKDCCPACAAGEACAAHPLIERGARRPVIRRRPASDGGGLAVPPDVEPGVRRATSGGEALPQTVRAFFEPRFGEDLGHVRVHTDRAAAESARALRANAFTRGNHIAFADGQYAPGTAAGDRLLAHELAHVAQQRSGKGLIRRRPDGDEDVKRAISREVLAKQRHLKSVRTNLEKALNKRQEDIKAELARLGPNPKSETAKDNVAKLRRDLAKDLQAIENQRDEKAYVGLRADIVKWKRKLKSAKDELDKAANLWGQYDAVFASKDVATKLGTSLTPAEFKALIGQESGDLTLRDLEGDIAGIAQMGSAEEKRAGGKPGDRKVPEKAIPLAAKLLADYASELDRRLTRKVTGAERAKFIMAAYNGGVNLIIKAQREAIGMKREGTTWQSLVEGGKESPLYKALRATSDAGKVADKYDEITRYIENIGARLPAPAAARGEADPASQIP